MTPQQAKAITLPILERLRKREPRAGHCPSIAGNWGPVFDTLEAARGWIHVEWNRLLAEEKLDVNMMPMIHTGWFEDRTGGKAP
jgi:hypothetical protein